MFKYILHIALFWVLFMPLPAKDIKIAGNDYSMYPLVKTNIYVFDSLGLLSELDKNRLKITDNNNEAIISKIELPGGASTDKVFAALAIDLSGKYHPLNINLDVSKQIAAAILEKLDFINDKAAIISYDNIANLVCDFTDNKSLLLSGIYNQEKAPGSDLNNAFTFKPSGIFEAFKVAKANKALIIIGDSPVPENIQSIRQKCLDEGIRVIYTTIFSTPDSLIDELCRATGGICFESTAEQGNIANTSQLISSIIHNTKPFVISWNSQSACPPDKNIGIELYSDLSRLVKESEAFFSFRYQNPATGSIEAEPEELNFYFPGITGIAIDTIKLKALKSVVLNYAGFDSPEFNIISGSLGSSGLTLEAGSTHVFVVGFQSDDSARHFSKFIIKSGECIINTVPVIGGYPNRIAQKSIRIINPECGRILYSDNTCTIRWDGIISREPVSIDYSTDNGTKWINLSTYYKGFNYPWLIPPIKADSLKFRVSQIWPPGNIDTVSLSFNSKALSAFFNCYGDKIVIAKADSSVEIRDSYTGELLWSYKSPDGVINWALFAPGGESVIFNVYSKIFVYNLNTNSLNSSVGFSDGPAAALDINPYGTHLIAAFPDGYVKKLEIPGLSQIESFDAGQGKLFGVKYSPDGKYFVTCGSAENIKVWDAASNSLAYELSAGSSICMYAAYSPRMDKLVATSWYGRAFVWRIQPGKTEYTLADTLYTVSHMKDTSGVIALNFAEFTYDSSGSEVLITAGLDKAALWDARDGKSLKISFNHRNNVSNASANIDGSRIVTASWDSSVVITNMFRKVIQSGITECPNALGRADIAKYEVDFGEVPVNYINDTLILNGIEKISGYDFPVRITGISGASANSFRLISPPENVLINKSGSLPLYIRYQPKSEGSSEAYLNLNIPGSNPVIKLVGSSYKPALGIKANLIDFGNVEIGDYKDTTVENYITNLVNSSSSITIEKDADNFIIYGKSVLEIEPLGNYDLKTRFLSVTPGRHSSVVNLKFDSRPFTGKTALFANSVEPVIDTIDLTVPIIIEKSGKNISIPIKINKKTEKGIFRNAGGLEFEMSFNKTLLEPMDKSNLSYKESICTQKLFIPYFEGDSLEYNVNFMTALGSDSVTELTVTNPKPLNPSKVFVNISNGLFKLGDLCRDGGIRLFMESGTFFLAQNSPNPFSEITRIDFSLIENSYCELFLCDILGNKIKILTQGFLPPGLHSIHLEPEGLESGIYYYTLKTQSNIITKHLVFIRNQ